MRWCLDHAGLRPQDLDVVAYSFDPGLAKPAEDMGLDDPWDHLRLEYARRAPAFLATALPGLRGSAVTYVPHHVAHAASAGLAAPRRGPDDAPAVLVVDGRGERWSHLAGQYEDGRLTALASQELPHSLGLVYESLTEHLGFLRSSDEFKVMALASYGKPRMAQALRETMHANGDGSFVATVPQWDHWAPPRRPRSDEWRPEHADLAASVQLCLEEVLVDLARWLHAQTGSRTLTMAGGTALNCVANSRIWRESPFDRVWVQPAAGDAGTALGAALHVSADGTDGREGTAGAVPEPFTSAALGREWSDDELAAALREAAVPYSTPGSVEDHAAEVAQALAEDRLVAWFDGRSELGPRALGQRSLMAHPGRVENLERLNRVKGREQFRPVAPMVLAERAPDVFSDGPIPSPYMLFVHHVHESWRPRIPAVVHVDGTARVQTVEDATLPRVAAMLRAFEKRTGLPVVVNTSLNTAGRPMVDSPRDALELFGSTPVDLLVLGPHLVRRADLVADPP
jgi:carbamoyltransferase